MCIDSSLNVHDSLLPAYAGFSPLIWALINDEPEVGVTAHIMDETLDAGPIVLQCAVPVGPTDTTTDLFQRTLELFGPITVDELAEIASGRTDFTVSTGVYGGTPGRIFYREGDGVATEYFTHTGGYLTSRPT